MGMCQPFDNNEYRRIKVTDTCITLPCNIEDALSVWWELEEPLVQKSISILCWYHNRETWERNRIIRCQASPTKHKNLGSSIYLRTQVFTVMNWYNKQIHHLLNKQQGEWRAGKGKGWREKERNLKNKNWKYLTCKVISKIIIITTCIRVWKANTNGRFEEQ